jgi:hypothetical protein
MPGKGPLKKPDDQRARSNSNPAALKVIHSEPAEQPSLPELMPNGEPWPQRTLDWWRMWSKDPLAADFRAVDWSELLDLSVIHGQFWSGDIKVAGELRLRGAKFGVTPEDRARLRITFAAADEAESKPERKTPAGSRYKGLRSIGGVTPS